MPWKSTDPNRFSPEAVEVANLQEQRMNETFRILDGLPTEIPIANDRTNGLTLQFGGLLKITTISSEEFAEIFKPYTDTDIPESFN